MSRPATVQEAILAARALIADPAHWTQNVFARDADGNQVAANDPRACCRCAEGAICSVLDIQTVFDSTPRFGTFGLGVITALRQAGDDLILEHGSRRPTLNGDEMFSDVGINDGVITIGSMSPHEAVLAMFDRAAEQTAPQD